MVKEDMPAQQSQAMEQFVKEGVCVCECVCVLLYLNTYSTTIYKICILYMHTSHVQSDAFAGYTRIVGGHLQSLSVCSLVTRSVRSFIYVHLCMNDIYFHENADTKNTNKQGSHSR